MTAVLCSGALDLLSRPNGCSWKTETLLIPLTFWKRHPLHPLWQAVSSQVHLCRSALHVEQPPCLPMDCCCCWHYCLCFPHLTAAQEGSPGRGQCHPCCPCSHRITVSPGLLVLWIWDEGQTCVNYTDFKYSPSTFLIPRAVYRSDSGYTLKNNNIDKSGFILEDWYWWFIYAVSVMLLHWYIYIFF